MERNYRLTDETIIFNNRTLYRIEATKDFADIKKGDKGGFIEKYENLCDNAWVYDNAKIYGNAEVYGNARVYGNAKVYGDAKVYGHAIVYGEARVFRDAEVYGYAEIFGEAIVFGDAIIHSTNDYCTFSNFGSENRTTTFFKSKEGILVACGCFKGTIEEFKEKVKETHKGNKHEREYLKMIELVEIKFE
ncbi:hypothetical protein AB4865_07250 [Capnocytophaga sp. ARDL2]|uniref:hypothetical protein n=1 Tax=Capnocytophaga sp. ARDL2 TaxID=3238809 RepID=UPI003556CCAC